jgi:hypothetical protein
VAGQLATLVGNELQVVAILSSRLSSSLPPGSPIPSGQGDDNHSHNWMPSIAPPVAFVLSRSAANCFRHRLIRTIPPVPSLVVHAANGQPMRAMCFRDNPSTPHEALLSMVGTDERRDWVEKQDRGSDLKGARYGCFNQAPPSMHGFSGRIRTKISAGLPCRSSRRGCLHRC